MHHQMTVDGSQVHYWTFHDDKQPTILLIHGFTGSHEGFQYIIPQLKNFRVIAPDLPGFGKSSLNFSPWTVEALACEVNKFVHALKLPVPPYVISHSLGGLIAASMLSQQSTLFQQKTIFISPVATKINLLDSRKLGAIFSALHYNIGKRSQFGEKIVKSQRLSRLATNLLITTKQPELRQTIHDHHLKNLDYISSIDFYHALHNDIVRRGVIDYQTKLTPFEILIVSGAKDNVTPLKGERLLAKKLGAKLEIIPDVGHLAHYETPDAIAKQIVSFLE